MKGDRGAYRALYCAILDDADAAALSDRAWRVLTLLKLSLPASGIGIPVMLQLAQRANCTPKQIDAALAELEAPKPGESLGWIVRERNIVWLVNGLKHEPNLNAKDKKHRRFVAASLAPLGTKPIVAAFRAYYADWFDAEPAAVGAMNGEGPSEGLGRGIEGPSKGLPKALPRAIGGAEKGHRRGIEALETRDGSLTTKPSDANASDDAPSADVPPAVVATRTLTSAAPAPPPETPAWLVLHAEWEARVGPVDKGRFRKAFRPICEPEGGRELPAPLPILRRALERYAARHRKTREWAFVKPEQFVAGLREHLDVARMPADDFVKLLPLPAGAA